MREERRMRSGADVSASTADWKSEVAEFVDDRTGGDCDADVDDVDRGDDKGDGSPVKGTETGTMVFGVEDGKEITLPEGTGVEWLV